MNEDNKKFKIWYWPLIEMVVFAGTWYLLAKFLPVMPLSGVEKIENANVSNFFINYNQYFGVGLGFLSMIFAYLLLGLAALFKYLKQWWLDLVILLVSVLPWLLLSLQLVYFEKRYTDLAKALIAYSARPMLWASMLIVAMALLVYCWNKRAALKKIPVFLLMLILPIILTGCVGQIIAPVCPALKNGDYCYQTVAIQESLPEICEKIKGSSFFGASSNPPRDKCYLKIAQTADMPEACDQIKGGLMSYSREECLLTTARIFSDPLACAKLENIPGIKCEMELMIEMTPEKLLAIDQEIAKEGNAKKKAELQTRREAMYGVMSGQRREEYEKLKDRKIERYAP